MITVLKLERKNMFLLEVQEFIGRSKFLQIYFFNPLLKILNIMTRHKLHLILLTWNSSKFDVSKFVFALISQLNYFPTASNKDIILKILKAGTAQIEHVRRDAGASSLQSSRDVLSTYYQRAIVLGTALCRFEIPLIWSEKQYNLTYFQQYDIKGFFCNCYR